MDRETARLAIRYAALFLSSVAVLSLGIMLYMNAASGGDYLGDIGLGADNKSSEEAQKVADAVQDRLEQGLLVVNGILLLTIPFVSYRMARAAIRPIQQSLEAQQQFVDNASHELMTPITVLSGELQLAVSKQRKSDDYVSAIKDSLEEVGNLANLTKSLTLLARGDASAVRQGFEEVDLDRVVRECLRQAEAAAGGGKMTWEYEGRPGSTVKGDRSLLRTMIYNLIDNAIKYSPEGGKVLVTLSRQDEQLHVSVRDFGPGMTDAELGKATRRFWRADKALGTKGSGLGLSITDQIARLHYGRVTLKHGATAGLEAAVSLPSAKA